MSDLIRIGTRASKLAMWQTNYVAGILQQNGLKTEIFPLETKGDKVLNAPFSEIGTKGVFTEELEEKLKHGEIDIAVHSAKDMQSDLGPDLDIIAFTIREDANDVLVSFDKNISLKDSFVVGTSSTRRRAIIKHYYPQLEVTECRGNLQTRFRKMEEGQFKAMILAYAGVHRMECDSFIIEKLPLNIFTPAVGQGSIAIESSSHVKKEKRELIRKLLNHPETEYCLLTERAFLKTLEGGCSVPLFALAHLEQGNIVIEGGVIRLDGKKMIREKVSGRKSDAVKIGEELAAKLIIKGANQILEEIKQHKKL